MRFPERLELTLADLLVDRSDRADALVPSLRAVQQAIGWVSPRALEEIARRLWIAVDDAASIADDFAVARTPPTSRHTVEVCVNGSCSRRGSEAVLDRFRERLGVEPGQVSADGAFALVDIICLRNCGFGPSIRIDGKIHDGVSADAVDTLLADLDR